MAHRFADVVNRANVWMIQRRSGARLALEASPRGIRRKPLGQDFNGDVAIQPRVAGAIHLAHTALADGGKDLIRTEFLAWLKRHLNESAKSTPSCVTCLSVRRARRLLRVRPGLRPRRGPQGALGIQMQGAWSKICESLADRRTPPTYGRPTRPLESRKTRS